VDDLATLFQHIEVPAVEALHALLERAVFSARPSISTARRP
jgi:hypothetical protein